MSICDFSYIIYEMYLKCMPVAPLQYTVTVGWEVTCSSKKLCTQWSAYSVSMSITIASTQREHDQVLLKNKSIIKQVCNLSFSVLSPGYTQLRSHANSSGIYKYCMLVYVNKPI